MYLHSEIPTSPTYLLVVALRSHYWRSLTTHSFTGPHIHGRTKGRLRYAFHPTPALAINRAILLVFLTGVIIPVLAICAQLVSSISAVALEYCAVSRL
jgi:hypothetical protein